MLPISGEAIVSRYVAESITAKFTNEQYTTITINQSTAGRFNPRVFVNCLQNCTIQSVVVHHIKGSIKRLALRGQLIILSAVNVSYLSSASVSRLCSDA